MLGELLLSIPLFKLINAGLVATLLLLCFVWLAFSSWKIVRERSLVQGLGLPAIPSSDFNFGLFKPGVMCGWDYLLTGGILALIIVTNLDLSTEAEQGYEPSEISWINYALSLVINAAVYVPLIIRWRFIPRMERRRISIFEPLGWFVATLFIMGWLNAGLENLGLVEWLVQLTESPELQEGVVMLQTRDTAVLIYMLIAAVIIAPIGEELLFRGFLYPALKSSMGKWGAILLSSFMFGAVHMALVQTLLLSVFGVILCLAYERAKSIWLPIVLHALFNGLTITLIASGVAS